jgi:hypothetical protein
MSNSDRTAVMTELDQEPTREPDQLPITETHQPDPMLQMTTGRIGAGGMTLVAFAAAAILFVVFYGLNAGDNAAQQAANTPSATHSAQPQAGGKSGPPAPSAPRANASGVKG